jgi:hypothetical protein
MRFTKRLLMGIGAVALAGTILTLAVPKAVHAAVAALVLVTNTSANPVPNADVNAPGEEPFQTILCNAIGSLTCDVSQPSFFVVPSTTSDGLSVKRLVIEYVSVSCFNNGVSNLQVDLTAEMDENPVNGLVHDGYIFLPLVPASPSSIGQPVATMPVRAYADPGKPVGVGTFGSFPGTTGASCTFSVIGHYITH